ncbi:MAG: hypothetical protein HY898_15900 [Deltaproteobacteria bacterium]|nr:hypothetical protein [Deltaproteobacteria bacterium]
MAVAACGGGSESLFQGNTAGADAGGAGGDSGGVGGANSDAASGSGGSQAKGGSAGAGGADAGGCGPCNDGISCTLDECQGTVCTHKVGPNSGPTACPTGTTCDLLKGCIAATACTTDDQCVAQLGSDACKTGIKCDPQSHVCTYKPLDKDQDSFPPVVCGGTDCDDDNPAIFKGAIEVCDGKDNDCDGKTDVGATCSGLQTCTAGACSCPPANTCGADCIDKQTSDLHCGTCGNACPSAAHCQAGACVCTAGAAICSGLCVDLDNDPNNCGSCNAKCAAGYACQNKTCLCTKTPCNGACIDTASDPANCGGCNKPCGAGQSCVSGQCTCPGNVAACNGACPNYQTDPFNCGGCAIACTGGKTCVSGSCQCTSGLSACGGVCVNTLVDPQNCGSCGVKCGAGKSCSNGVCIGCPLADLVVLIDNSGSMDAALASSQTRWAASVAAIKAFIAEAQTATFGVGLQYIAMDSQAPTPCTDNTVCTSGGDPFAYCDTTTHTCVYYLSSNLSCAPSDYANLAVSIAPPTSTQIKLIGSSLDAHSATFSTPQHIALQGALSAAKTSSQATGHRVAVVMLTDGIPNECPQSATVTDAVNAVAPYASGTPKVPTYVVGVGTVGDADWQPTAWSQIAAAGGTSTFYSGTSQAEIQAALDSIRNSFGACP